MKKYSTTSTDETMDRPLDIKVDRPLIRKMLGVGNLFDLNEGGYCDARGGCVNFWCGPDDKPNCWPGNIQRGALKYPRDYVGAVYFNWINDDEAKLVIEADPFRLFDMEEKISKDQVNEILNWLERKATNLYDIARMAPDCMEIDCHLCEGANKCRLILKRLSK